MSVHFPALLVNISQIKTDWTTKRMDFSSRRDFCRATLWRDSMYVNSRAPPFPSIEPHLIL